MKEVASFLSFLQTLNCADVISYEDKVVVQRVDLQLAHLVIIGTCIPFSNEEIRSLYNSALCSCHMTGWTIVN